MSGLIKMTRREWMLGASGLFAASTMPAKAAPNETPEAFLQAIYKNYLGKDANGVPLDKAATLRRYFAAPLADAMIKDNAAAAKRGDVPELDGDPFIDGQDWELSELAIKAQMTPPDKATATATFKNFGKGTSVLFDLVKTAAGWRIADIKNGEHGERSLRALYHLK